MTDIIRKTDDGPRKEDLPYRSLIDNNRNIIKGLANALTGGEARGRPKKTAEPRPDGKKSFYIGDTKAPAEQSRPVVSISLNDRVLVIDSESRRQLMLLGNIRSGAGGLYFSLATQKNGYVAVLDNDVAQALSDLDGCVLSQAFGERELREEITQRLEFENTA